MIGEKIRAVRIKKKMTQSQLVGDFITRNMLSQIENGIANPSMGTVTELAKRLGVPVEYFVSEIDDLSAFEKLYHMDRIKAAYRSGEYKECLGLIGQAGIEDDETELISADCSLKLGVGFYNKGMLASAKEYLGGAIKHSAKTMYDTEMLRMNALCYINCVYGIINEQSPYADMEIIRKNTYKNALSEYIYIKAITSGKEPTAAPSPLHSEYAQAHALMLDGKYGQAEKALKSVLAKLSGSMNAVLLYFVLCDLEKCFTEENDYKNAYECANKKVKLAEIMKK